MSTHFDIDDYDDEVCRTGASTTHCLSLVSSNLVRVSDILDRFSRKYGSGLDGTVDQQGSRTVTQRGTRSLIWKLGVEVATIQLMLGNIYTDDYNPDDLDGLEKERPSLAWVRETLQTIEMTLCNYQTAEFGARATQERSKGDVTCLSDDKPPAGSLGSLANAIRQCAECFQLADGSYRHEMSDGQKVDLGRAIYDREKLRPLANLVSMRMSALVEPIGEPDPEGTKVLRPEWYDPGPVDSYEAWESGAKLYPWPEA